MVQRLKKWAGKFGSFSRDRAKRGELEYTAEIQSRSCDQWQILL